MKIQNVKTLKGGSLNTTKLYETDQDSFIRKYVRLDSDREYGYVRWYSQFKKLQRFNQMFPGLVPEIRDIGEENNHAYVEMEYVPNLDIKTLFQKNLLAGQQVIELNTALWKSFDLIHSHRYKHCASSLSLYFIEEVEQKLNDARKFSEFEKFYQLGSYTYQGKTVRGLNKTYQKFKKLFNGSITEESYVHGNPTLENMLYDPLTKKVTFIDLYEEGIVDSKLADYSMVLQCSHSLYGVYNDHGIAVNGNAASSDAAVPSELIRFNDIFNSTLADRCSDQELALIKLFEATQFFRMLPFKCHAGYVDAAKFFYVHACYLVNDLL